MMWDNWFDRRVLDTFRDLDSAFDWAFPVGAQQFPLLNAWVSDHDVIVQAELPGVAEKDVEVTVANNVLGIQGSRKPDEVGKDETYHRRERPAGAFSRSLRLPYKVATDKVEATFKNGLLRILLPRAEEDKPRKIEVKSE